MRTVTTLAVSLSLALLLSLVLPVSAVNLSTKASPLGQNMSVAPAPMALATQRASRTGRLRFARRLVKEKNTRRKYTVDASYPQIIGAKSANALKFNRAVKDQLTEVLNEFKKGAGPPDASVPKEIQWSSFDGGYSIEYDSPDLVSIAFSFSPYYAGAAHPLHYSMVLNYDLKTGRTLSLSDLFKPRSNYLQLMSDYSIKELTEELGDSSDSEWIQTGAAPDSKNYKSWNITSHGLSITFDPYQVAAYVYGEHVVEIPYAALGSVINMDGPLGPLSRQAPAKTRRK